MDQISDKDMVTEKRLMEKVDRGVMKWFEHMEKMDVGG